jgi:hypothetical protein
MSAFRVASVAGEIRHHMGLPTKAQAGDGANGPEPAVQRRRDRRDVCGGRPGRRGGYRHWGSKALVAVAAQIDNKGIGQIRLRRIPAAIET